MSEQFENPEAAVLDDKVISLESPKKKIENIADKAASQPAKREQKYDKEHKIFTI